MRRSTTVVLVALLVLWPLTFRYSSVGVDLTSRQGPDPQTTFYRLRWPGNGSAFVGLIRQDPGKGQTKGIDLGGDVLKPAHHVPVQSTWNRLGFFRVDFDRLRDDPAPVIASDANRVWLVGFPHWLLVLGWLCLVLWRPLTGRLIRRRSAPGESIGSSPPGSGPTIG
jgi:hypothetical protein